MTLRARRPSSPAARALDSARLFADNPVVVLTLVFIGLFVATDIVNRVQSGEAFLTPKQVSTTFLYAAILGLMAAGQTLVMLTGGVDLSVATTATTGAFMISSFATDGAAKAIGVALLVGLGIGIVNGIGVAIFRVNPLIMTLGVSTVTLGALTIYSQTAVPRAGARPRQEARLGAVPHLHPVRPARLGADLGADHPRPPLQRLRAA